MGRPILSNLRTGAGASSSGPPFSPTRTAIFPTLFLAVRLSGLPRAVARALRSLWVSVLHPFRRWRSRKRISSPESPRSVLFLCLGNICRSPYAERALVARLRGAEREGEMRIRSAGLIGPDRPSPPHAVQAAGRRGVDLPTHRSVLVSSHVVDEADLIVVMEPGQKRILRREFSVPSGDILVLGDLDTGWWLNRRIIRDPIESPLEVFEETYERIDRCLETVVRALQSEG